MADGDRDGSHFTVRNSEGVCKVFKPFETLLGFQGGAVCAQPR